MDSSSRPTPSSGCARSIRPSFGLMPRVSDAYRQAMRERLLAAAAAVVVQRGYDGTTVRDILAQADVAPSTLYAYFQGKDDIVRALTDKALAARLESLDAIDNATAERLFAW